MTDDDGRVVETDAAFERVFGFSPANSAGAPLDELVIAPRFRAAYRAMLRDAAGDAAGPDHRTSEFSVVRADGGELPVHLSIWRTREDPARVTTRVSAADESEVTHSGSPDGALQRRIEELAGIGTWELEHGTGKLRWSENLFRLLGLEPGAVTPSFDYVASQAHPNDGERVLRAREELRRTGRLGQVRFRYLMPDARVHHVRVAASLVAGARGPHARTYGILQDVTERRAAEQELAARFAVTDLLANWPVGEAGLRLLLRDLGEPLDFEVGALWVRDGDARIVRATWQAPALARPALDRRMRESRRPLKAGLIGAAWQTARPASVAVMSHGPERLERLEADLQGALALPATFGDEVLAVISLASRDKVELSGRLMRTLGGIGHELGHFFARRRAELSAAPLTPRELEVLQLVARGGSRSQVAERLHVSESTVKTHLEHIYAKLDTHDRAAAVGAAMRQGLIT
ncbi:MAG TPA: LuxR C-terminal-related transcriptional regulator [Solirubrobacteraceae bacterium]|nr:LuxR C-terminal-related transcriptional regulator [Solirubrobacteraceae bacterium]